jgi:hypothetical protein
MTPIRDLRAAAALLVVLAAGVALFPAHLPGLTIPA